MDQTEPRHPTESAAPAITELPLRRAARVVVLDPGNRVLLLRYDGDPPGSWHWSTPGGGLNDEEDYITAAQREVSEEAGWNDITMLGEIHQRALTMQYRGRLVRQHERLYLARTDRPCRALGNVAAMHAADGIASWRWWTLEELDATTDVVWPPGLAGLIRSVLS